MIGDLAAALDPDQLDPAPIELGRRRPDVRLVGVPPERQDRPVLDEQQHVADRPSARAPASRFWSAHARRYGSRPSQAAASGPVSGRLDREAWRPARGASQPGMSTPAR